MAITRIATVGSATRVDYDWKLSNRYTANLKTTQAYKVQEKESEEALLLRVSCAFDYGFYTRT